VVIEAPRRRASSAWPVGEEEDARHHAGTLAEHAHAGVEAARDAGVVLGLRERETLENASARRRVDHRRREEDLRAGVVGDDADDVAVAQALDGAAGGGDRVRHALALHRSGLVHHDGEVERDARGGAAGVGGDVDEKERFAVGVGRKDGMTEAAFHHQCLAGGEVRAIDVGRRR
jgi:hypothetical protein